MVTYDVREGSTHRDGEMTTIHEGQRWEISLSRYVTHKGTADYLNSIRAEIIPGTAEDVDPALLDEQGRYKPT
jgi:hypothetical protein